MCTQYTVHSTALARYRAEVEMSSASYHNNNHLII